MRLADNRCDITMMYMLAHSNVHFFLHLPQAGPAAASSC
jgi:hypothetical protein